MDTETYCVISDEALAYHPADVLYKGTSFCTQHVRWIIGIMMREKPPSLPLAILEVEQIEAREEERGASIEEEPPPPPKPPPLAADPGVEAPRS